MSAATIVLPTGVLARIEITRPVIAQRTEIIAEQTVTDLKLLNTRIAERAGKITRAEMSREPTRFIASTIITAMIMAITRLYTGTCVPIACAKASSKVTAKILL